MIFFIDIDGTIRDYMRGMIPSAVKALKNAKEQGHILILCTGRTMGMIPHDVPVEVFDGIISGGGCRVELYGELLKDLYLDTAVIARYRRFFEEKEIPYVLEAFPGIYLSPKMKGIYINELFHGQVPGEGSYPGIVSEGIRTDKTIEDYDKEDVHATKMGFCLTAPQFAEFSPDKEDELAYIAYDDATDGYAHCELVRGDSDKGAAVRLMLEKTGCKKTQAYAFGDSTNDISMMNECGNAVVMGNASDMVKKYASYITADVCEDGFYKALTGLKLI